MLFCCLFFSFVVQSQGNYRITNYKGEYIYAQKVRAKVDGSIDILRADGKIMNLKENQYGGVREIIPNWPYFNFGRSNITEYLVMKVDSIRKEELYKLINDWIKNTYRDPKKAIKAAFENEKIRIEGFTNGFAKKYAVRHTIEISVREGRYKFDPIALDYYIPSLAYELDWGFMTTKHDSGDYFISIPINDKEQFNSYYNQNGYLKVKYRRFPPSIEKLFNDLNQSLFYYISKNRKGTKVIDEKDKW